jgi:malonate transporter MadL subunit
MVIFGLALLSGCMFVGMLIGDILGFVTGVGSNVGGVGFAMLLLILVSDKLMKQEKLSKKAQSGILFWSALYIPVVVAMTACQNAVGAFKDGGVLTIVAGVLCTIVPMFLIPVLSKIGAPSEPLPPIEKAE